MLAKRQVPRKQNLDVLVPKIISLSKNTTKVSILKSDLVSLIKRVEWPLVC
jgi:hypothetical protein